MSGRIAVVDGDREIDLIEADGSRDTLTGTPDDMMWGSWLALEREINQHSWPTFSPEGDRVAAFRVSAGESVSVWVGDLDGVRSAEIGSFTGRIPIYLQWSQDGTRIAVVLQDGDDLLLASMRADGESSPRMLAKGSPLFFTWDGKGRIAAFVGGGSVQARMLLLDPDDKRPSEVLPGMPGDFCAPVRSTVGVLYGAHMGNGAGIWGFDGGSTREYPGGDGLLAFVPSPDGSRLARACAGSGDGTPYTHLTVLDLETGAEHPVCDTDALCFFWTPDGRDLVVARVDSDRGVVEWTLVSTEGVQRHIADLIPTPDMRFYLRFFEQYTQSHPLVSPDSQWVLMAGVLRGHGSKSQVWKVSLTGAEPESLGDGQFAVYGPGLAN